MSLCGRNRVVVLILALVVGGAGGYFAHVAFRSGPAEVREPTQRVREVHPVPARRTARRPVAESAELKELRERVMSLEAEFDEVTGAADEGRKENLPGKDAGAGGKSEDVVTSAEVRAKCKTYGDWKRQYPKHWEKDHGEFVKKATRELQKYAKWQQALSALDTSGMTEEERDALYGDMSRGRGFSMRYVASSIGAFAGAYFGDREITKRAWHELLKAAPTKYDPEGFRARAYAVDSEGKALEEISWISTNYISQWCLNVIMILAFAPEAMPGEEEVRRIFEAGRKEGK